MSPGGEYQMSVDSLRSVRTIRARWCTATAAVRSSGAPTAVAGGRHGYY